MAIRGFGRFVIRKLLKAVLRGLPRYKNGDRIPISILAFDLNGLIHKALNLILDDKLNKGLGRYEIITKLKETFGEILLKTILRFNPQDVLILAVDGVAPGAKIQQQRSRREKAPSDTEIPFSRNEITPGTDFMIELDQFIREFIETKQSLLPPKIIYSSHLVPGEGEHKIMDYFRDPSMDLRVSGKFRGINVVYGLDSDLFMLTLVSPLPNIYLARESDEEVINIDVMKRELQAEYNINPYDFVVLMFLIGNDFLPPIPSLGDIMNGIDTILKTYSYSERQITEEDSYGKRRINWIELDEFLKELSADEEYMLANVANDMGLNRPEVMDLSIRSNGKFYYKDYRAFWYVNELGYCGDIDLIKKISEITEVPISSYEEIKQNKITSGIHPNELESYGLSSEIDKMCSAYRNTMAWVFRYYTQGTASINQEWSYPYLHTPLLKDLSNSSYEPRGFEAYDGMVTFNALQQLVAVLPAKSVSILPKELQVLTRLDSPIKDTYPNDFKSESVNKKFPDKDIPIIPVIDRSRIVSAVSQIVFDVNRAKIWVPAEDLIVVKSAQQILTDRNQLVSLSKNREYVQYRRENRPQGQPRTQSNQRGRGPRPQGPRPQTGQRPQFRPRVSIPKSNLTIVPSLTIQTRPSAGGVRHFIAKSPK